MAKGTEVQKLLEERVNAAGTWRERVRTLTGEVSQAVPLAVVTTNCENVAKPSELGFSHSSEEVPVTGMERRAEQSIS